MKFIYITPFVDEDFFDEVKRGMRDAADLLGVTCVFAGTQGADYDALIKMIKDAVNDGYDGIALSMAQPTVFREAALLVQAAGIPLIAFNIDSKETYRMAGVSQNFKNAGRVMGKLVYDRIKKNSTVIITMHDAGVSALEERADGILELLKDKNLEVKTVISGNTPELAKKTILESITPEVTAILCTGQSDTHGAGLAVKETGKQIYVAGFDVCEGILELIQGGTVDFTIDQQPYVQGFYPLLMMVQYIREGVIPFDIDTGSAVIKKK